MRYYVILIFTFLLGYVELHAQVTLSIQKIDVSNVLVNAQSDIIKEGDADGPYVNLSFCISNDSNKVVVIYPSKSRMYLNFNLQNRHYSIRLIPVFLNVKDSILLNPHEQFKGTVGEYIFLGTNIIKSTNNDYRIELIESIPTIKVEYFDVNFKLISSGILSVNVLHP